MFKYLKDKRSSIGLGLLLTVIMLLTQYMGEKSTILQRINGIIYDVRLEATLQPRKSETSIIIVDLDERSMQTEGRWPWSRFKIAKMVEKLAEAGAVVVALDIMFSEPERNPVDILSEMITNDEVDPQTLAAIARFSEQADADNALANAIQNTDVVLGMLFSQSDEIKAGTLPRSVIQFDTEDLSDIASHQYLGYVNNIPKLQAVAPGIGFINGLPESDGFIRSTLLIANYENRFYPSLALEATRLYSLADEVKVLTADLKGVKTIIGLKIGRKIIPTDAIGKVLVPFKGPARSYKYISATDLLNDNVPANTFDSALVFVGTSAVGNADLRATPVGVQYPGVEVHANVADALLNPAILPSVPDWMIAGILALILFVGLTLTFTLPALGPLSIAIFGIFVITGLIALDVYLWSVQKLSLAMATPLMLSFGLTIMNIAVGFFTESGKRRQIKGIFDQYVPPAHIDKMLQDPDSLNTAGERKEMTVLFSDIRSFTTISEKLTATELANLLNRYFSPITKAIFEHHGTIDKYVGDMVMAFWNAPLNDEDHAEHAIMCAFQMLDITRRLTIEFEKEGWPEIRVGVGLNTGEMNVGDMGSEYRRAYTVLGDAVNLGSRLEGLTKFYGVDLLVSEFTVAKCPKLTFRPMDKVRVKGKDTAVSIFEPIHPQLANQAEVIEELDQFKAAYADYLGQNWPQSVEKFTALVSINPDRKIYSIYLERITVLEENPPGTGWDGSFTHTSK